MDCIKRRDPSKYVWLKGEKEYKRYGSIYAPTVGTLSIDIKDGVQYLSFDPTEHRYIDLHFDASESYNSIIKTHRGKEFPKTLSNVGLAVSMVATGGLSSYVRLGNGASKLLNTWYGRGIFDMLGQVIISGNTEEIDFANAAASAFVGNKVLKNLLKSFADLNLKNGFNDDNIKGLNEGFAEFGLRISVDAASTRPLAQV